MLRSQSSESELSCLIGCDNFAGDAEVSSSLFTFSFLIFFGVNILASSELDSAADEFREVEIFRFLEDFFVGVSLISSVSFSAAFFFDFFDGFFVALIFCSVISGSSVFISDINSSNSCIPSFSSIPESPLSYSLSL